MNNKLFAVLRKMVPNAESKQLNGEIEQIHFFTDTHECSITDFSGLPPEVVETLRHSNRFDNDVQWLGNVRFSATSI